MDIARVVTDLTPETIQGALQPLRTPPRSAVALAERCLASAGGDLVEFVRLFTDATRPAQITEEVASSTADWAVQARRWLWKNFPPYRGLVRTACGAGFVPSSAYPLPPMVYPGFDGGKSLDRTRKNIKLRRENDRRGVVRCQAIVNVDTKTGESTVHLVSTAIDHLRKKAPQLVGLVINGRPWHDCLVEEASRWTDLRGGEVAFIRAMCHLCPDPRLTFAAQMTPEIVDEALSVAGLG